MLIDFPRITRSTFVLVPLLSFIVFLGFALIGGAIGWIIMSILLNGFKIESFMITCVSAFMIISLVMYFYGIFLSVCRLKDIGASIAWVILYFIPGVHLFFVILLSVLPGNNGQNRYGKLRVTFADIIESKKILKKNLQVLIQKGYTKRQARKRIKSKFGVVNFLGGYSPLYVVATNRVEELTRVAVNNSSNTSW